LRPCSVADGHAEANLIFKNSPLEKDVIRRLEQDPRIADPAEIAVVGDGGTVTLRGTVERFSQRHAAEQDARGAEGVYEVVNRLKVSLPEADRREDDQIRRAALQKLTWHAEVPPDSIDVKVQDGWVALNGDVSFPFQSDAAYDVVSRLYGVAGVTNEVKVASS
jgi:osmotically-inducible protein OsmY